MCRTCQSACDMDGFAVEVTQPTVPLAGPILEASEPGEAGPGAPVPNPGPLPGPSPTPPIPELPPGPPEIPPRPFPFPPFVPCRLDLRDGCWAISVRLGGQSLVGTLRVDRGTGHLIISGDLYNDPPPVVDPGPDAPGVTLSADSLPRPAGITSTAGAIAAAPSDFPFPFPFPTGIPVFARANYQSYLKITSARVPIFARTPADCRVTMTVEQYLYTQPPSGSFQGSFPATPSRTLVFDLAPRRFPILFPPRPAFGGRVLENGVEVGTVTIRWVSRFFRRARVEIDVLTGSVAADPVPDASGTGSEWFNTVFAKIGWDLTVVTDQVNVAVPAGIDPNKCSPPDAPGGWNSAALHALLQAQRNPAANLDTEWYMHLMFVPARLGCGRGVMFDQIDVPREGVASFSDDGYPPGESANFGTAASQRQRDVPRAFLRSACHEITHGFNQIHQEAETTADNSIMTTTPSVADVLGGPTTGDPGIFPDDINLGHNLTVRNHLVHMPDPVIRPGGWPFASWFGGSVPQASDRAAFDQTELTLAVAVERDRIVLGEPVLVSWTLTNSSPVALRVPGDVSAEALFATVHVTDPRGTTKAHRPVAIVCDTATLRPLEPGESVAGSMRLYWSTTGFAFERPGQHTVTVVVQWAAGGRSIGVEGSIPVFVDFPASDADNAAASLLLDPEVGLWVALGGGADHLSEATTRINLAAGGASGRGDAGAAVTATAAAATESGAPTALRGFAPLLNTGQDGGGSSDRPTRRPRRRSR